MDQKNLDLLQYLPIVKFKGVPFRDINPLLEDPKARTYALNRMREAFEAAIVTDTHHYLLLMESRGFLFVPLACPYHTHVVLARKPNKLPGEIAIASLLYSVL
jgi:adenine/guanine phosphoribosyltransferase-like PRPP-binding protein